MSEREIASSAFSAFFLKEIQEKLGFVVMHPEKVGYLLVDPMIGEQFIDADEWRGGRGERNYNIRD